MGLILNAYRKQVVHRYDDEGYIKYYSAADFPGLQDAPFRFASGENRLSGHVYSRVPGSELVLFCHGIGGGHRSYMKEIDLLCRRGFTVIAWDNTGCFDSEGEAIRCMAQSLADLDAAIGFLKAQGTLDGFSHVYAVGHSWGGFAVGNIPLFRPEVEKAVVISGFVSVERLLAGFLGGAEKGAKKFAFKRLCAYEKKTQPHCFSACTADAAAVGQTKFLFVHSTDDPTVPFALNAGWLRDTIGDKADFLVYDDKKHNPNYTSDAAAYLTDTFGRFNALQKAGKLKTIEEKRAFFADADWARMTAQDEDFWDRACAFLRG